MKTNSDLERRRIEAVARGVAVQVPFFVESASNAQMTDVEGNSYIDFAGGMAVLNTGHLHPKVKQAVLRQLDCFSHTMFQVAPYEQYVRLAERLNALVPVAKPAKTLLVTTGAEAVENAYKIARAYTGRTAAIAFTGAFHGRTMTCLGLTGKIAPYKLDFGPTPPDIYHVPFPNAYYGCSVDDTLTALDSLFRTDVEPSRVAAIFIEPVQGEGGFHPAPKELMLALREICDRHGILLVSDEIQSGFARTGKLFATEHYGIKPDLITMAKSLAGGFPLAAVAGRAEIMDTPQPGALGGTYSGSPISCAAANAVLDIIEEESLCARSEEIGAYIEQRLLAMKQKTELYPIIGEIRRLGAMVGVEFVKDGDPARPDADLTRMLATNAIGQGLVLVPCGDRKNVIRFLVPLTASEEILRSGMDIIERVLTDLS